MPTPCPAPPPWNSTAGTSSLVMRAANSVLRRKVTPRIVRRSVARRSSATLAPVKRTVRARPDGLVAVTATPAIPGTPGPRRGLLAVGIGDTAQVRVGLPPDELAALGGAPGVRVVGGEDRASGVGHDDAARRVHRRRRPGILAVDARVDLGGGRGPRGFAPGGRRGWIAPR